jgi:hypothetical protein
MRREVDSATTVKDLLSDVEDYYMYHLYEGEEEELEEFDTIFCLFYEITIQLFNFKALKETKTQKYFDDLSSVFFKKKNGERVFLTEFIPLIGQGEGVWTLKGEEYFYKGLGDQEEDETLSIWSVEETI